MSVAFAVCMFALDRVRTVLLALSLIVLVKTTLMLLVPDIA
jgi:hypothetical protein